MNQNIKVGNKNTYDYVFINKNTRPSFSIAYLICGKLFNLKKK